MARTSSSHALPAGLPPADARTLAVALGAARCAVGGLLLLSPRTVPRLLGVDPISARQMAWSARMAGGRDLIVGVATLVAPESSRAQWVLAGIGSDATDAFALGRAAGEAHLARVRGVLAAASAVAAAVTGAAVLAASRSR